MSLSRRDLVRTGAVLAAAPAAAVVLDQRPTAAAPRLPRNPFTLGVASGDPASDGFVIWTRLAINPFALDGRGGMPARNYPVRFQVATDPRFRRIVRDNTITATPEWGHSVRAVTTRLAPGREYWYRWRLHGYTSPTGRAVTAPRPGQAASRLDVVQMSCSNFAAGWFTAYRRAAEDRPQLMIHLGDYIYEYGRHANQFRKVTGPRCSSLADFRLRYAEYRTDPDLQRAHAVSPWLVTFDDHEVENNYAGLVPHLPKSDFASFRAQAYKAWFENQPVRWPAKPSGAYVRMHRRLQWGTLANLHLLDTRQYRSDQPCNQSFGDCPDRVSPDRTMLGEAQTEQLRRDLAASSKRWDVLAQQVFFSRRFVDEPDRRGFLLDSWDGYSHNRQQVLDMLAHPTVAPRNAVVLTGDTHAAWLSDIKATFIDPASPTVGTEIGCTSISSSGDGHDGTGTHPFMKDNPHIRFHNSLRGYCRLRFEPDQLTVDYRVVDRVTVRDAPVWTRASFAVPDRESSAVVLREREPAPSAARVQRAPDDLARATLREELGYLP